MSTSAICRRYLHRILHFNHWSRFREYLELRYFSSSCMIWKECPPASRKFVPLNWMERRSSSKLWAPSSPCHSFFLRQVFYPIFTVGYCWTRTFPHYHKLLLSWCTRYHRCLRCNWPRILQQCQAVASWNRPVSSSRVLEESKHSLNLIFISRYACENVNKLLVGNKSDLQGKRAVETKDASVRFSVISLHKSVGIIGLFCAYVSVHPWLVFCFLQRGGGGGIIWNRWTYGPTEIVMNLPCVFIMVWPIFFL